MKRLLLQLQKPMLGVVLPVIAVVIAILLFHATGSAWLSLLFLAVAILLAGTDW